MIWSQTSARIRAHARRVVLVFCLALIASAARSQDPGDAVPPSIADTSSWQINPGDYQFTANLVVTLFFGDRPAASADDRIALFHGLEPRAIASPILVDGSAYFFVTVYGNVVGETLEVYGLHATSGTVAPVDEEVTFTANAILGSLSDPLVWRTAPIATSSSTAPRLFETPHQFELHSGYPNPFNPNTTIAFDLPYPSDVQIGLFDETGRQVTVLLSDTNRPGGRHEVVVNGSPLASGRYFAVMRAGDVVRTRSLIVLR